MKRLILALCSLALSTTAFAGIPSLDCSTPDSGIRIDTRMGMQQLEIRVNHDQVDTLPSSRYQVAVAKKVVLSDRTTGTGGGRSYHESIYAAELTISGRDGHELPDPWSATKVDGKITVFAICKWSVF